MLEVKHFTDIGKVKNYFFNQNNTTAELKKNLFSVECLCKLHTKVAFVKLNNLNIFDV